MSRSLAWPALLRSEWTKLSSVRSTWWCTAVFAVVAGGAGWLAAATSGPSPRADVAVQVALTGFGFAQLALVVLGVLAVTAEFSTGMALVSWTVVPRRGRLLAAKTLVVAGWSVAVSTVLALTCFLAARTLTAVPGGVSPADPSVLRVLGLQVVATTLVVVLAVGVGTVLRSTAGAVGLAMALVFIAPPGLALAGSGLAARLSQALPALRVGEDAFLAVSTSWPVGLAVLGAWAAGTWVLGAVLLGRRDV